MEDCEERTSPWSSFHPSNGDALPVFDVNMLTHRMHTPASYLSCSMHLTHHTYLCMSTPSHPPRTAPIMCPCPLLSFTVPLTLPPGRIRS